MAVPSSGELELYGDIGTELGVAQSNVTLHGMSQTAGFTPPDAMSEFYGYDPTPPVPTSFNTVIWSGNGSTNRQITDLGFAPDWVWVKERNPEGLSHNMYDTVRGAGLRLFSDLSNAESTLTEGVKSFDINGFTVGNSIAVNRSGSNFVAWCFKAGGAAVTNTNGSVTSQVSANVAAGFSIVKYTATGGGSYSVGHGLSQTPDFVIVKPTTENVGWTNWSSTFPNLTKSYINFTTMAVNTPAITVWGNGMTSTVIGQTSGATSNPNQSLIAYVFHSVAGFSKFGTYTGNGSTNGPTVTTGFQPAFVMIKCTSSADTNWTIWDNKRDTSNPITVFLQANNSGTEASARNIDFNADSFQLKSGGINENESGQTYIYIAFANQF